MSTAVSVVIPTYNAITLLEDNLPIVFAAMESGDQVVLVDDASTDDTVINLLNRYRLSKIVEFPNLNLPKGYYPQITPQNTELYQTEVVVKSKKIIFTLVVNRSNLRFAGACNKGVALANNDLVFLLNNDVKTDTSCISQLKKSIQKDKSIFAVGCIEYSNKKKLDPSGKNKLWFERGMFIHSKAEDFSSGETAWASGGSSMFSRSKWMELLGFDPNFYPAYWEDIDLSYRAKEKNWKVLFDADATVFHKHETTNANVLGLKKIQSMSWRHAQYFTWKHTTFQQKLQFLFWQPYWWLKRYLVSISI